MSLQHVKTALDHFNSSQGVNFLLPSPQIVSLAVEFEPLRSMGDDREGFAVKKGLNLNVCEEDEEAEEEIETEQEQEEEGGAAVTKSSGPGRKGGRTKVCARGHWRPAEDAKLKELVAKYGPQNWNLIAENLQGRSGKSCRLRWFNQLDPRINRKPFSEEEEERLLAAHRMYGNKWAMIARLFPGRTDNAVKNHWHVIVARKQREQSNTACGRRRNNHNLLPHLQTRGLNNIASATKVNHACSDSTTISSNFNESAVSTCTDLSLTPSSARAPPLIFARPSESRMCSSAKRPVSIVEAGSSFHRLCNNIRAGTESDDHYNNNSSRTEGTVTVGQEADHYGVSDTNSDASAAESMCIGNHGNNHISFSPVSVETEESGTEDDKIDLPFIDFLGVGVGAAARA